MTDGVSIRQNLSKTLRTQDIPESGLSQKACGAVGILNVSDGHGCIVDSEVDHSVNSNCHTVFGKDLGLKGKYLSLIIT